jgi:DNA-binding CsgD family transcriptional regulator/tetratricopeptide (TPR) repeat protein
MELIERDDFLDFLHSGFRKIASGEGHCYFIIGEPGIGKTSLVKAFLNQVEDHSIQYVGACDSLFTPRPLAPLYDLAFQIQEDWVHKIQSTLSRAELFTTFVRELTNKSRPVVLVFEDIHWADEATLDFIKFFARRISRMKCLFILTCRDDEISQQHSLRNVLGDLSSDTFTRIQLLPLSREAVYKMADEKGYDAENVYNISGGNPFYVNEILASYSPGVPDNIKDSILSVYNRQREGTKNVWQIFSVIPEGLEVNRFAKIKSSWEEETDHCFALKIIIVKNDKIIFKHELYRRTIENSLSPFKRIALNKKILELFLSSFEEEGEIERIVHYAKNANENSLVVKYAPIAARQAASVGAHIEASKLFLTAIEYFEGNDTDQLVEFYEAYAYECYLTSQITDAIIYQGKALKIWQKKNEVEQAGNSLRFLSRLWWFDGKHEEAEKYGKQAIEILQSQPSSKAKAMAFSNMSQLKMLSEETAECIKWGTMAIEMAKEIKDDEILCHALNNVGSAQWKVSEETGKKTLLESLDIALKNSFHEHAARAYSNIISISLTFKEYDSVKQFLQDGIDYCEERNLDSWKNYELFMKSKMLLDTGDWNQAASIVKNLLATPMQLGILRMSALTILAIIKIRRGEPDALFHLLEAKILAFKTKEHQQIVPVMIACLEYEWLAAKQIIAEEDLKICTDLVHKADNIFLNSDFDFWLEKARQCKTGLAKLYEPYKLLRAGKINVAAAFWEKTGCPFEKALVLSEGNDDDKRNALSIFQQLGADAVYEKIKMEMRSSGIKKIPRGLRESTKTNPAQLTNRELEVLQLLRKDVQNKEIAGTLFISPKTVGHHISSILFKLDVSSRSKAVTEAVRLGILK